MTKTVHICDECGKQVDWVYKVPKLVVKGLSLEIAGTVKEAELCEDCMRARVRIFTREGDKYFEVSENG